MSVTGTAVSGTGSEQVQGKLKICFLAASAFFAVSAYRYTHPDARLLPEWDRTDINSSWLQSVAVNEIIPMKSWMENNTSGEEKWSLKIVLQAKDDLLPMDDYLKNSRNTALSVMEEYYPSQQDLEAFCEENENY